MPWQLNQEADHHNFSYFKIPLSEQHSYQIRVQSLQWLWKSYRLKMLTDAVAHPEHSSSELKRGRKSNCIGCALRKLSSGISGYRSGHRRPGLIGPSLSANIIIGYYRMYELRAKARPDDTLRMCRMILICDLLMFEKMFWLESDQIHPIVEYLIELSEINRAQLFLQECIAPARTRITMQLI